MSSCLLGKPQQQLAACAHPLARLVLSLIVLTSQHPAPQPPCLRPRPCSFLSLQRTFPLPDVVACTHALYAVVVATGRGSCDDLEVQVLLGQAVVLLPLLLLLRCAQL